jgi:hypothetical protein
MAGGLLNFLTERARQRVLYEIVERGWILLKRTDG